MYRDLVADWYKECIRLSPKIDGELKRALNINHRVPVFIDNLSKQFKQIQDLRILHHHPLVDNIKLKEIVYEFTELFVVGVKEESKRMFESDLAKIQREQAQQNLKDLEETAKGNPSGDYAEIVKRDDGQNESGDS